MSNKIKYFIMGLVAFPYMVKAMWNTTKPNNKRPMKSTPTWILNFIWYHEKKTTDADLSAVFVAARRELEFRNEGVTK